MPTRSPRRIRTRAAGAGLVLGMAALLAPLGPPAGALPTDSDTLVLIPYGDDVAAFVRNGQTTTASYVDTGFMAFEGDFSATPGTDVFVYGFGDDPDGIVHVTPTGPGVSTSFAPETVRGVYSPFAGDFDGNGIDDVFWYGPGPTIDSIWLYQADGSHQIVPVHVNGSYDPVVGDFDGDGDDDVVWYGVRATPDSLWVFDEGTSHTVRPLTVNGEYIPLAGHFGGVPAPQEQIIWYAPDGPDSMWTFTPSGPVSRTLPGVDRVEPVVGDLLGTGRDAVFWYKAGSGPERVTSFGPTGVPALGPAAPVSGSYHPVAGDFDGDGDDGIAWVQNGKALIWSFGATGPTSYTQTYVDTGHWDTYPFVAHPTVVPD